MDDVQVNNRLMRLSGALAYALETLARATSLVQDAQAQLGALMTNESRKPYDPAAPCDDAGCDACGGTLPEQVPMERIVPLAGWNEGDRVIDSSGNKGFVTIVGSDGVYIKLDCLISDLNYTGQYYRKADLVSVKNISKPQPMTPHSEVHAAVVSRGLRVGMTYQEVHDNKWTQCEGEDPTTRTVCTEGDQCSACKFLDAALCECGESFTAHSDDGLCGRNGVYEFALASWPRPQDDGITSIEQPPMVDAASDNNSQKETNMTEPKKPRINRATWHESEQGKQTISDVIKCLSKAPLQSWLLRQLVDGTGEPSSDVSLALDHLLSAGAIVQHGKAKGTRYAVTGFTDWPLTTREKIASKRVADAVVDTIEDAAEMLVNE